MFFRMHFSEQDCCYLFHCCKSLTVSCHMHFAQSDEERIRKLEEQLNQVTQELQEMKNEGGSENSRLDRNRKEHLAVLAEELKSELKDESVGGEVDIELKEVFGGAPGASKVYLKPGRGLIDRRLR